MSATTLQEENEKQRRVIVQLNIENREGFKMLDEAMALLYQIEPPPSAGWQLRRAVLCEQMRFYPSAQRPPA